MPRTKQAVARKERVGVTTHPEFRKALQAAAQRERRTLSNLCEILLDWAFDRYSAAGTLDTLLNSSPSAILRPPAKAEPSRAAPSRVSQETRDQLIIALDTILERAPSPIIEEVSSLLTERAGRYGEPQQPKRKGATRSTPRASRD